jgi:hypothetical protein
MVENFQYPDFLSFFSCKYIGIMNRLNINVCKSSSYFHH